MQHDAKWIPSGYADGGKISVFNNGDGVDDVVSYLEILNPVLSVDHFEMSDGKYLPEKFDYSWNGTNDGEIYNKKFIIVE